MRFLKLAATPLLVATLAPHASQSPTATPLLVATLAAHTSQSPTTDRIVEEDIRVRVPLLPCTVPRAAIRIAESLQVPLGLELVPEPCAEKGKKYPDQQDEVVLTGMSVTRAFDRLVQLDERYVWSEADGVLILRPGTTWFDPNHFLNRKIPQFRVKEGRMWAAMDAVHLALGGARGPADEVWPATTPQSDRRFSVSLGTTTVVDALNAVVRAHGSMRWRVEYCKPQALFDYAMLRLNTFDGGGIGRHSATRRDDGTWSDACRNTSK